MEFVLDFERPLIEIEKQIKELKSSANKNPQIIQEIEILKKKYNDLKIQIFSNLTPIQKVQLARHPHRPVSSDYINMIFTDFIELHGDGLFSDDKAIICGLAKLDDIPVSIIAQQKGKTTDENLKRNFAMLHPEGYRKALRIMKLSERFSLPIISFIDTPGAFPGIGAEERGQARAIAENLMEMSNIKVPIICVVISEGGSGGALGIGVGDRILMLQYAFYSVISPEGCAAILFKDSKRAPEAAEALKLTAKDLYSFGIIDEIIPEPIDGAHRDPRLTAENIKKALKKHLDELSKIEKSKLLKKRYQKYRKIGVFVENKKLYTQFHKGTK